MKVQRFNRTERLAHWTNALGFLALLSTGLAMLARRRWGGGGEGAFAILRTVHAGGAVLYIAGPLLCWLAGNTRSWWNWIREAHRLHPSDFSWMALMVGQVFKRGVVLPPQGRFNPGQRLNIWLQLAAKAGFLYSGQAMFRFQGQLFWFKVHLALMALALPLLAGHLFLALIHRDTRPSLSGMISGWVDAHWARHHHARWLESAQTRMAVEVPQQHEDQEAPVMAEPPKPTGAAGETGAEEASAR